MPDEINYWLLGCLIQLKQKYDQPTTNPTTKPIQQLLNEAVVIAVDGFLLSKQRYFRRLFF